MTANEDVLIDFIRRQPVAVQLQMIGDAARTQNTADLERLKQAGVFEREFDELVRQYQFDDLALFHVHEYSALAALVLVAQSARDPGHERDVVTGVEFEGERLYDALELAVDAGYREFFMTQVDVFATQIQEELRVMAGLTGLSFEKTRLRNRFNATMVVLLSGAAAMNDAPIARVICEHLKAHEVSKKIFGQDGCAADEYISDLIFSAKYPNADKSHSPALVAIKFASNRVLDVLIEYGWDPKDAPLANIRSQNDAYAQGEKVYTASRSHKKMNFIELMRDTPCCPMPSIVEKILSLYKVEGQYPDDVKNGLQEWAVGLFENSDLLHLDMMRMAFRNQVYEIDAIDSYMRAAQAGCLEVMEHLNDRVDWSKFTALKRPINAVFESSAWDGYPEEMQVLAMHVMKFMVEHGRSDLLSEVGFISHATHVACSIPILECADKDMLDGVLLCLEHGGDPYFEDEDDRSAMSVAKFNGNELVSGAILAFTCAKAAREALAQMNCELTGEQLSRPSARRESP